MIRVFITLCLTLSSTVTLAKENPVTTVFQKPLTSYTGKTLSIEQLRQGKPAYLKFWASWCQPCMQQMPHFEKTQHIYKDKISVIGINAAMNETPEDITAVINRFQLSMPTLLDSSGELAEALGLVGTPYHLLLNKEGDIIYSGHDASVELDSQLLALAAGQDIKVTHSISTPQSQYPTQLQQLQTGTKAVLFTASWCDSYLQDKRHQMATNCHHAQRQVKHLSQKHKNLTWHLVLNRLWTGDKELQEFTQKQGFKFDASLDTSNHAFKHYKITQFPTLF